MLDSVYVEIHNNHSTCLEFSLDNISENIIFEHFTNCYKMYDEMVKILAETEADDTERFRHMLLNVKDSVLKKFQLECEREPVLHHINLSSWVLLLENDIKKLEKSILNPENSQSHQQLIRSPTVGPKRSKSFIVRQLIETICSCSSTESGRAKPSRRSSIPRSKSICETSLISEAQQINSQLKHFGQDVIPKLQSFWSKSLTQSNDIKYDIEMDLLQIRETLSTLPIDVEVRGVKNQQEQQRIAAVMELLESELSYVNSIEVITKLFLTGLLHLQSHNLMTDISIKDLFCNICDVYNSNIGFWSEYLLNVSKILIGGYKWESAGKVPRTEILNSRSEIEKTLQPYMDYCLNLRKCQTYCDIKAYENECFKTFVTWCEKQEICKRLQLTDLLAFPFQRITKYPLLVKAILKYTVDENQRRYLEDFLEVLEVFIRKINRAMKHQDDAKRLQSISESLGSYEMKVSGENELNGFINHHKRLDLFRPMPGCGTLQRRLIHDCPVKIKSPLTPMTSVHFYLFTDMLLLCKKRNRSPESLQIIHQPYIVDRLITKPLNKNVDGIGLIYVDEFEFIAATWTIYFEGAAAVKKALVSIKKAQQQYQKAKLAASKNATELASDELKLPNMDNVSPAMLNECNSYVPSMEVPRYKKRSDRMAKRYLTAETISTNQEAAIKEERDLAFNKQLSLNYGRRRSPQQGQTKHQVQSRIQFFSNKSNASASDGSAYSGVPSTTLINNK